MTRSDNLFDRMSDRVMDLDSPTYGDERERSVYMESSSFGLTIGLYTGLFGAVIASLFGLMLLPVGLLIMTILPWAATHWYARRRGVNINALAGNSGARSTLIGFVVSGAGMALAFAGMAYTVFAGQSLLPGPSLEVIPGEGFFGGFIEGAVVGGILGGFITVIGGVYSYRKAKQRSAAEAR